MRPGPARRCVQGDGVPDWAARRNCVGGAGWGGLGRPGEIVSKGMACRMGRPGPIVFKGMACQMGRPDGIVSKGMACRMGRPGGIVFKGVGRPRPQGRAGGIVSKGVACRGGGGPDGATASTGAGRGNCVERGGVPGGGGPDGATAYIGAQCRGRQNVAAMGGMRSNEAVFVVSFG